MISILNSVFTPLGLCVFFLMLWLQFFTDRAGSLFIILTRLPSTVCHELAHFMIALLTGARPCSFSIWPKRTDTGWTLGSVSCANIGVLSAFPVAMAPLLNLVPAYYLFLWEQDYGLKCIVGGFVFFMAALPSGADFWVAFKHPMSSLLWLSMLTFLIGKTVNF